MDAVDELLLLQRGKELGYKLTDEQFKQILDNIKKENKIETEEQFQAALKPEGMTLADLRRTLEKPMIIQQVQGNEVLRADLDHRGRGAGVLRRAPGRVHHAGDDDAARDPGRGAGEQGAGVQRGGRTRRRRRRPTRCTRG